MTFVCQFICSILNREMKNSTTFKIKRRLSTFQIIVLGFVALMFIGCFLLMLPISTVGEGSSNFMDAFFTSTSAVCVTGLVVQDTASYWTFFGQLVILCLIQIGGLGVVTVVVGFAMSFGRKIGLMQRNTMQAAISAPQLGGIMKLTSFIFKVTFIIESVGAICLMTVFIPHYGFWKGLWTSIFTSISAFCNAGFDILGSEANLFPSLTIFRSNVFLNIVVMTLIVIGGIGFTTWNDFRTHKLRIKAYLLQSKIIITTTFILLLLPTLFFYFYEFKHSAWNDLSNGQKFLASIFQAVTPRTAGFNTVDLSKMSDASNVVMIMLMLIGGAPGSTAGGMKVTTIAVMLSSTFGIFKRKSDTECYGRRLKGENVKNAMTVCILYLLLFFVCGLLIFCIENSIAVDSVSIMQTYYETASALGTVGISLGITTKICAVSRLILIFLMFFGRVGGLTIIFAATSQTINVSRKPEEGVSVG